MRRSLVLSIPLQLVFPAFDKDNMLAMVLNVKRVKQGTLTEREGYVYLTSSLR